MEIDEIDKKKTLNKQSGFMVRVSRTEALAIIASLANQIRFDDNNGRREEFTALLIPANGKERLVYFSIAAKLRGDE